MRDRRFLSRLVPVVVSLALVALAANAAQPPAGPFEIVNVSVPEVVKGAPDTGGRPVTPGGAVRVPYALPRQAFAGENEPNGTTATASPIVGTNVVVRGMLYPNGDVDFYSFAATAGDRVYAAAMTSFSAGNSTDSQLTILASDGTTVIEFDDDNGSFAALSSSIAGATIPSNGTYYLKVNDFTAGTTSERGYELHFRLQSGAPTPEVESNDTPATANPLPANGWVSGTRDPAAATEQDWYSLTLNAGDTVYLSLDLDPERDGTVWNGRLGFALFGDASNQILVVDDAGTGDVTPNPNRPSEAMFFTVKNAGTYYAFVDSATAATGGPTATYHLSVSVHPATNEGVNCTVYTSTDVPKTIGPGTGLVSSTITVPGNPRIADLDVEVVLSHALMQDVDAHLRSPAGTDIGLFTDIGAAATGGQAQMDVVFDDEAGITPSFTVLRGVQLKPENNSTAGTASTSGGYRLSWFDGQNAGGTWTLDLRDDTAGANGGTLTAWSVRVCEPPPPPTCAAGYAQTTVFSTDFESGAAGFTHSGAQDEWELGLPATVATTLSNPVAGFSTCNSGVNCWKTDLDNTYNASSNQDLLSPAINLAGLSAPVVVTWAQRHQVETANFDRMFVDAQQVGGATPVRLYEWVEPTPISASVGTGNPQENIGGAVGWGVFSKRVDSLAGLNMELRFHLDSDSSVQFAGLAIDDVSVTACRALSADLAITKTDGVVTATPGGSVTYTVTASNAGPDSVIGATVADTFPAILTATWTCVGAGGGTCTAAGSGNVNDTVDLPAGGSVTYTVTAVISPAATGTLSNTATVSSTVADPSPANNSATDTDTLAPMADLAITKTDGVTAAVPGQSVTYTITASNAGPSNAPGVLVADTFPAALTASWTCAGAGGGTCTPAGVGNLADTVNLPAGGSVTYTVSATISASATGTLSNTATVAAPAGVTDPIPGNNSATDTDTLTPQVGLGITKTDGLATASPGQALTYTIVATNSGPSTATGATVSDTFPAGFTGSGWTCFGLGGATCSAIGLGNLSDTVTIPPGGSVTYSVNGAVTAGFTGTLSNTATVTSGSATQSVTDTTLVASPALVAATKSVAGVFVTGGTATYTIVLSNTGGSAQLDNPGAEFTDTLPAGLSLASATASAGTASAAGSVVTWNGTIPPGGSVTVTIVATITAPSGATVSNQGQASFDGNGDGTNETTVLTDDPSLSGSTDVTAFAVSAAAIPVLPPAGLAALALAIAALGVFVLGRKLS